MVRGIGIDMATISEFERYWPGGAGAAGASACAEAELGPFIRRTFTPAELACARERGKRGAEFLAGRFAVKEAVFKAVAPLTAEGFDLRIVECLPDPSGAPRVTLSGPLAPVLAEAGVADVLVSITNEGDYAVAVALVQ